MEGYVVVIGLAIARLVVPIVLFLTIGTLLERRIAPHWR